MRLVTSAIVCLLALYAFDAYFFGGLYFQTFWDLGRDLAENF
jgi:hypothetical protein